MSSEIRNFRDQSHVSGRKEKQRKRQRERGRAHKSLEYAHLTVAMFPSKSICKLKFSVLNCYCLHMTFDNTQTNTNTYTLTQSINKLRDTQTNSVELLTSICVLFTHEIMIVHQSRKSIK